MSLTEALRDRLEAHYTIEIVDPQPRFFHLHYRLASRYALWLWSAEFRLSDTPRQALIAHRLFTRLVAGELTRVIERVRPTMIITTYPFLTYEVMQVLVKINAHIPFVMLLSDPNGVHASWLTERRATAVLATTRETYEQALAVGFDPERLHMVGWPVRAQFSRAAAGTQRCETLERLGLDPERFTVFLQGGGEGAAQFGRTVERVLGIGQDLQVILATGTNQALLARFKSARNLYALPFTKEIAPFLAAADVIMGKAGPNMLFEAVTLGKPFIATAYIPGQEQANLEFILRHQLGWVALDAEQQCSLLLKLLADRSELQMMAAMVDRYREWNTTANERIVPLLKGIVEASAPTIQGPPVGVGFPPTVPGERHRP
jgi:UDP-N-acetylglucosamine:LPS N-acetylglucosamine transferase